MKRAWHITSTIGEFSRANKDMSDLCETEFNEMQWS